MYCIKEKNMNELYKDFVSQTEKYMKLAFREKFNADIEVLLRFAPQDFRREIREDEERYYWCDDCFMIVKMEQGMKKHTIKFNYIFRL